MSLGPLWFFNKLETNQRKKEVLSMLIPIKLCQFVYVFYTFHLSETMSRRCSKLVHFFAPPSSWQVCDIHHDTCFPTWLNLVSSCWEERDHFIIHFLLLPLPLEHVERANNFGEAFSRLTRLRQDRNLFPFRSHHKIASRLCFLCLLHLLPRSSNP